MKYDSALSFIRNLQQGVYNYTQNGKCSSCGECCTALLPVTKEELKAIKRYCKKNHIAPVKKHSGVAFDFSCPFRNEAEKKCNIYEVRPKICRDFKCDVWKNEVYSIRIDYAFDGRFHPVNLRDYFGVN